MVSSQTDQSIFKTLPTLLLAAFFLGGCEFLGLGGDPLVNPEFELTNDLSARIEIFGKSTDVQNPTSDSELAELSLSPVMGIRAPSIRGTVAQTSHISYVPESEHLYIGYKLGGDPFGGEIDVLDPQGVDRAPGVRSLRSSNVDVVEVRHDPPDSALFVAGAVNTRKVGASPALVAKVIPKDNTVTQKTNRLSDFVAKGLILAPADTTLHVVTDENALFQLDRSLENQSRPTVGDAAGFRSPAAHGSRVFVLDRSGRVFGADASEFSGLSEIASLGNRAFNKWAIARLVESDGRLFAALNQEGFPSFRRPEARHGAVAGLVRGGLCTRMAVGSQYLYVGRRDGVIEAYQLPKGISEEDAELERVKSFRLWGGDLLHSFRVAVARWPASTRLCEFSASSCAFSASARTFRPLRFLVLVDPITGREDVPGHAERKTLLVHADATRPQNGKEGSHSRRYATTICLAVAPLPADRDESARSAGLSPRELGAVVSGGRGGRRHGGVAAPHALSASGLNRW